MKNARYIFLAGKHISIKFIQRTNQEINFLSANLAIWKEKNISVYLDNFFLINAKAMRHNEEPIDHA